MDGSTLGVAATEVTLSAEGLDQRGRVSATRAWLWAMARNEKIALPDALFHHDGEAPATQKPSILWRPATGGIRLIAVGSEAQSVLLQSLDSLVGLLTRATQRRVTIGVDPMQRVYASSTRTGQRIRYVALNMAVAKRDATWSRWNAMDDDARREWLAPFIERHLDLCAQAWDVSSPAFGWQVRVKGIQVGDGAQAVITRGIGRHGKTIFGAKVERVLFDMPVHLEGPWCAGFAASKGYGRIIPARRAGPTHG